MRVRWTTEAYFDLKQLSAHIAADNPAAARRVSKAILAVTRRLRQFPESGRPGRVPNTRELVVPTTPYIVVYRILGGEAELLHVVHGAQEWPPFGTEGSPDNG